MADIRELVLLANLDTSRFTLPKGSRLGSRIKLAIRRFVVATSGTPLRYAYLAIYRLHVAYAVRLLRRFPGVQSIYLTGSVATGEISPGISDIDLTVNGTFSDGEQQQIAQTLRGLSKLSPLYDTLLGQCVQTLDDLRSLYETDYFFQYRFDQGRMRWKLAFGEDIFPLLPPIAAERKGGGYYTEVRTWWSYFQKSAFGFGPTATDAIFRNSIAYKTYTAIAAMEGAFTTGVLETSRPAALDQALQRASASERTFLHKLETSARGRHLRYEGDVHEETFQHLMPLLERVHAKLASNATFQPAAWGFQADAAASEMLRTAAVNEHIDRILGHVRQAWPGYRGAFLVPCLAFFHPDDLGLLLDVDPARLPTVAQVRELVELHVSQAGRLRQRVVLYLLLPQAAYQLDILSTVELWRHTLSPEANPEVFTLLQNAEFVLEGEPRPETDTLPFTRFARDLVHEEITIRRSAMGHADVAGALPALDLLRNVWRHIQLEIVDRSAEMGFAMAPLTLPAIERAVALSGIEDLSLFVRLREAYAAALEGTPVDVAPFLAELMGLLKSFE